MRSHGPLLCAFCLCFHFKSTPDKLVLPGYRIFRDHPGRKKGGGILIATRDVHKSAKIKLPDFPAAAESKVDAIWVNV